MAILQSDGVNNATDLILRRNGTEGLRLTSSTVQVSSINDGPLAGFRNAIINGNFDIWQRGTSVAGFGMVTADRWLTRSGPNTGGSLTQSRQPFTLGQTEVPGEPTYYWRLVFSGATGSPYVLTRIEDVRTFAGQTVTISFWAKRSSASSNCNVKFFQNFGTGGAPSAAVQAADSPIFTVNTSWTYITQTLSIPSISGKTLGTNNNNYFEMRLDFGGTGSFTFELAQVQVEAGPVATPFERRPIGTELALCQRYYQRGAAPRGYLGDGTGTANVFLTLPTVMRTAPSVVFTLNTGSSIVIGLGSGHLNITGTIGGSAPNRRIGLDDMKLDAEL